MAVNKTGAMFKSLTFDGEDSRNYGVYITGQAVFNAPEREVEMISIPGRNGQFALDMGRFENIEVTYPAGIFANTEADFAEAVSNFRNLLCSKRGYVRLQDEYHPDEYRMAIYKSGLELENVALKAGEFEITFDCKPQRYLTSGEEEVTVGSWEDIETYSGTIVNLTADGSKEVKSLLIDINPIQDLSGGNPSLSNICPISGWDEINCFVQGVNQWDEEWEQGYLDASGNEVSSTTNIRSKNFSNCLGSTSYCIVNRTNVTITLFEYDINNNYVDRWSCGANTTRTITTSSTTCFFKISTSTGISAYANNISVSYPSTEQNYNAYAGNKYTATLPSTVYGGSLDLASGLLNVKPYYASYNGETLVGEWVSDRDIYVEGTTPTIGAQVVNIGAEGTNTQITSQAISLLTGANNIFADSGDVEIEIGVKSSSGALTNPTLFDAEPLLKVKGYGTIGFNGYEIEIESGNIGTVDLWNGSRINSVNTTISKSFNTNMFNSTDTFTFYVEVGNSTIYEDTSSVTSTNANATYYRGDNNDGSISLYVYLPCTFTVGTSSTITNTTTASYIGGRTSVFAMTVAYDGTGNVTYTTSTTHSTGVSTYNPFTYISDCSGDSTLTRLGNPTYIDCELGECYKYENNTYVSLNEYIDLGSDLPKLAPGTNTFTKDNTITELKVVPRYWKV